MSNSPSTSEFITPEGQYPPYAVVTDTDHRAWIMIATCLCLAIGLIFGGMRAFVRNTICRGLGLDDAFLAAATILAVIQSSVIMAACADGFGKSIELVPIESQAKIQHLYYSGTLLVVIAFGLSKLSVVFLLLRLTVVERHKRLFYGVAGLIVAWTIGSLFALALQCNLAHPWIVYGERCSGTLLRWQIICAFDIATEICLVAMPVLLVWNIQASLKTKSEVVTVFAFRLVMIIPIAFRLSNFHETGRISDPTLREDLFAVWTQTELGYSLVSATIPSLRSFVNNLNTQFGGLGEGETGYAYGYSKHSSSHQRSNGSYKMLDLKSTPKSNHKDEPVKPPNFTGKPNDYTYDIWAPSTGADTNTNNHNVGKRGTPKIGQPRERNGDATSVDSNDSQQLIIRKEMTFEVEQRSSQ